MMIQSESIPIDERITAPITWDVQLKFIIQDLREKHYNEAMTLIRHHYFREEPMCKSIGLLQDKPSLSAYSELILNWMKDDNSLIAVSRKSGRVVGVLISKINSSNECSNTYSRVQIFIGDVLPSIMRFKSAIIKGANFYEELGIEKYLRVYILCVHPSYKHKPVGKALLEACMFNAFYLELPAVAGIFTSSETQNIAENVGFTMHSEIPYNNWLIDDEVVFDNPGIGNYSSMFMRILTPNEETLIETTNAKAKELTEEMERKKKK